MAGAMSKDGLIEQVRALVSALEDARDFAPWGRLAKIERAYRNAPHLRMVLDATMDSYGATISSLHTSRQMEKCRADLW
jgi:hypothetical protein